MEVLLVELEHAGKVFPGTRFYPNNNLGSRFYPKKIWVLEYFIIWPLERWEVHDFLLSVGYEYSGSLGGDDFFIRKDLNTPDRYWSPLLFYEEKELREKVRLKF